MEGTTTEESHSTNSKRSRSLTRHSDGRPRTSSASKLLSSAMSIVRSTSREKHTKDSSGDSSTSNTIPLLTSGSEHEKDRNSSKRPKLRKKSNSSNNVGDQPNDEALLQVLIAVREDITTLTTTISSYNERIEALKPAVKQTELSMSSEEEPMIRYFCPCCWS